MAEIDQDLIRWKRGKWIAAVGAFFILQLALLIWGSQSQLRSRRIYPSEPVIGLNQKTDANPEWIALENPFLFVSASSNGFSSAAWLRKPDWSAPERSIPVAVPFLNFTQGQNISSTDAGSADFTLVTRSRPVPLLPALPAATRVARIAHSQMHLSGFGGRTLMQDPPLPPQQHNDVLSSTVIEALVGVDGLVITARIIENSGSAKADAAALSIARAARFSPVPANTSQPQLGKLIFDWVALNSTPTNSVVR